MENDAARSEPTVEALRARLAHLESESERTKAAIERFSATDSKSSLLGDDKLATDALKGRLEVIEQEIGTIQKKLDSLTQQEEEELTPATPQQVEAAENLLRQARLAKTRGQREQALNLLQQAEAAAPNAASVLEFIGDELVERGQYRNARDMYAKAHKADPKNIQIERKFAEMVLRTTVGATTMIPDSEIVASSKSALIMSVLLPGLGQIVLGHIIKGGIFLGVYVLCLVWIGIQQKDLVGLITSLRGAHTAYSSIIFVPLAVAFLDWIAAVIDSSSNAKHHEGRTGTVSRPAPPSSLPFE